MDDELQRAVRSATRRMTAAFVLGKSPPDAQQGVVDFLNKVEDRLATAGLSEPNAAVIVDLGALLLGRCLDCAALQVSREALLRLLVQRAEQQKETA